MAVHIYTGEGEPMKSLKIALFGVLCAMFAGSASAGFVKDTFESVTPGDSVTNVTGWYATDATKVVISNYHGTGGVGSGRTVAIPTSQSVSNVPPGGIPGTKIWTDFYTIPRPFVSPTGAARPDIDTNATAQFFVSNGYWAAISGVTGTLVTTHAVDWSGTNITALNDGSTWYHVSVFHDYDNGKWALFVNGGPVVSNKMGFINPDVTAYSWFSLANGGGDATNVAWLDDVTISNKIPVNLTRDDDGDGLLDAWELMYYDGLGTKQLADANTPGDGGSYTLAQESYLQTDPTVSGEPTSEYVEEVVFSGTNVTFRSMETNGATGLRLTFDVSADRTYNVLYTPSLDQAYTSAGSFTDTNSWVDPDALSNTRGYYKLNLVEGPWSLTNDEVYTFFWQSREKTVANPGSNFWVGVVVDYGASNRLDSTLGQQLAQGLDAGDLLRVFAGGGETTFQLQSGNWVKQGIGPIDVDTPIPLGVGMIISRANPGTGTSAVMSGRMITSNSISLNLPVGWSMISWPFEGSNDLNVASAGLNTVGNTNDYMWVYRNGVYKKLRNNPNTTAWLMSGGGTIADDVRYLRFGEAVFYSNNTAEVTWSPSVP